jgi:MGT family glycosyltransferase
MRFLFTVWPYSGHVHPCLWLAGVLRDRGHEVAFYSGAASAAIEDAGFNRFPFVALAARVSEIVGGEDHSDHAALYARLNDRYTSVDDKNPLRNLRRVQAMYREMIVGTAAAQVADLTALAERWNPDVILSDAFLWGPALVLADLQNRAVVVFSFFAGCMVPGPGAPPHGFGLPRPRNLPTRVLASLAGAISRRVTAGVRRAASAVRLDHGLPPLEGAYFDMVGRMPLHLVASSPEYDYERTDLPPGVHYTGPCAYDPRNESPERLWNRRLASGQPVIYVSEGTCQVRKPKVLRAAAQGLGGLPLQVVMTTGKQRNKESLDLGPLASNITVESWVSLPEIFPLCKAIVTNGGSGTVRAALKAGLPMVVIPMEWDQLENAQRVVECGAGLRLSPGRCNGQSLRGALERVMTDPSFANNARRIAASFARYETGQEAAELLESLARGAAHVSTVDASVVSERG